MNKRYDTKNLEPACFYLRKSREDQESEARGEGETLAKHKNALFRLTKDYGVNITKVFEEVVSGESIIHRPEMLQLLKEVGEGKWKSVFCMEIDRLGRGDMEDQGLILRTFKQAKTLIVTPRKVYDLNDEFDEEYTEFEAFMARKELKIITRRLQGGRLRSVEDGNYLGTLPPYGYQIEQNNRKRYLIKNPEQTTPTELIWKLYRTAGIGTNKIANELNRLGYRSYTGKLWNASSILFILKNPVYAGITAWRKTEQKKSASPDKRRDTRTRPREEQIWIYNTHEAYVTEEEYREVQDMIGMKYHPPYQLINGMTNPLAGLIKCDMCGASIIYRPYTKQRAHLMCYNPHCRNKSTRFEFVETRLLEVLSDWLAEYSEQMRRPPSEKGNLISIKEKALRNMRKEVIDLEQQKERLHELLEKRIYDEETYLERSRKLSERLAEAGQAITEIESTLAGEIKREKARKEIIPKVKQLLTIYPKLTDPARKNELLKSVLEYADYRKEPDQKGEEFALVLHPKLPQ
ncbi:serine recombinase [Anaerosporomusa subterranea]|uniref:Serine recombinase n=1 Tax=Anaerosporomusa subterranea TaxID=1794912 RepID=A0A154BSZ1_ANASB|nr:recombinase family protein [Anaerosporomusa subterranea]KYZ77051.1 serine recombinase [Anaerosporomusa subterranea]